MNTDNDGKIRMRCDSCGKRVKFPAGTKPGKVYHCPVCAAAIVAPLTPGAMPAPSAPAATATPAKPASWQPAMSAGYRNHAIDKLGNFLQREILHATQTCQHLVNSQSRDYDPRTFADKLLPLRSERNLRLRQFLNTLISELEANIKSLENHPMRNQTRILEQLAHARRERLELDAYVAIFINNDKPNSEK